ncbi:unnamed protein product [Schistocephalus solidus]|uniref:IF rod domain-containing protein n=1 Tax=Schistocephalus solidus TaxID=70667 RepID=A0A183SEE7_SCHSO|nr:unnamed protein product [Schistocephalus solidus]
MDQSSQKDVHCSRLKLCKNTSSYNRPPPSPSLLSADETEGVGGVPHEQPKNSSAGARSTTATPPSALRCSQTNAEETSCFTTMTTTSQSVLITCGPSRPKCTLAGRMISNKQCQSEDGSATRSTEPPDVSEMIQGRAREMFELRRLNDRLSSFIERVRILEAQNRTSAKEASTLRINYTADISRMRDVYTADVEHLRAQLAAAEEKKTEYEVRLRRAEANLAELQKDRGEQARSPGYDQDKVNQLNDRLLETDRELQIFRQRCLALTDERTSERDLNMKLKENLKEANMEVDRISLAHHASVNEIKALREEICHHKKVHEAEMKEFSTLMQRESTQETVSIFRTEIMQVLREIQTEYEQRLEAAKADIQAAFDVKTQMLKKVHANDGKERDQYREENSKLRAIVVEQRKKLRALEEGVGVSAFLHHSSLMSTQKFFRKFHKFFIIPAKKMVSIFSQNMYLERSLRDLQNDNSERLKTGDRTQQHLILDLNNCQMELQRLRLDFEALLDSKLGLEMEIASYRRLLESEEKRFLLSHSFVSRTGIAVDRPRCHYNRLMAFPG